MDVIRYKLWDAGKRTPEGTCLKYNIAIAAKAKRSTINPYAIANELICLRFGIAMGLPVPLGVVIERDGELYYASLHVAVAPEGLPPATDEDLDAIAANERLTCGIVLFDSWILNEDRSCQNISYIDGKTFIFDHEKAFLDKEGVAFLTRQREEICIGDPNEHCLANRVKSFWSFDEWHKRMMSIPECYIKNSITLASEVGLRKEDIGFCTDYLIDRRLRLREIFRKHKHEVFPNLDEGLYDPLA